MPLVACDTSYSEVPGLPGMAARCHVRQVIELSQQLFGVLDESNTCIG
jgi:hypothetical protein